MIDLIIPYYNNPEGLKRTLDSIYGSMFQITIIDDNSDHSPWCPKAHQVFRYNSNRGPGYARQWGINKTHNEWIMFIDTGDIFIGKDSFIQIGKAIQKYSDANIISFPYIYKGETVNETSNRMHGKIYKRKFLEKYGITFATTSSYLNEDIGFNRACRLCTNIIYENTPIIVWYEDKNSLTQKDNGISLYRDQTRALSLNAIHTIEICRKNNIDPASEINQIAIALYYWFIRTAAECPQFLQNAWSGAKVFYDYFKEEIEPNKLLLGNAHMAKCLQYRRKILFSINILRFADDIWKNENLPNRYLTFN